MKSKQLTNHNPSTNNAWNIPRLQLQPLLLISTALLLATPSQLVAAQQRPHNVNNNNLHPNHRPPFVVPPLVSYQDVRFKQMLALSQRPESRASEQPSRLPGGDHQHAGGDAGSLLVCFHTTRASLARLPAEARELVVPIEPDHIGAPTKTTVASGFGPVSPGAASPMAPPQLPKLTRTTRQRQVVPPLAPAVQQAVHSNQQQPPPPPHQVIGNSDQWQRHQLVRSFGPQAQSPAASTQLGAPQTSSSSFNLNSNPVGHLQHHQHQQSRSGSSGSIQWQQKPVVYNFVGDLADSTASTNIYKDGLSVQQAGQLKSGANHHLNSSPGQQQNNGLLFTSRLSSAPFAMSQQTANANFNSNSNSNHNNTITTGGKYSYNYNNINNYNRDIANLAHQHHQAHQDQSSLGQDVVASSSTSSSLARLSSGSQADLINNNEPQQQQQPLASASVIGFVKSPTNSNSNSNHDFNTKQLITKNQKPADRNRYINNNNNNIMPTVAPVAQASSLALYHVDSIHLSNHKVASPTATAATVGSAGTASPVAADDPTNATPPKEAIEPSSISSISNNNNNNNSSNNNNNGEHANYNQEPSATPQQEQSQSSQPQAQTQPPPTTSSSSLANMDSQARFLADRSMNQQLIVSNSNNNNNQGSNQRSMAGSSLNANYVTFASSANSSLPSAKLLFATDSHQMIMPMTNDNGQLQQQPSNYLASSIADSPPGSAKLAGEASSGSLAGGSQGLIGGPGSMSSPLSTMFDVLGAATHYLMRFKPTNFITQPSFGHLNGINHHNGAGLHHNHQHPSQHHGNNFVQQPSSLGGGKSPIGELPIRESTQLGANSTGQQHSDAYSMISGPSSFSSNLIAGLKKAHSSSSGGGDGSVSSSNSGGIGQQSSSGFLSRFVNHGSSHQRRQEVCGKTIQTPQRRIIGGEGARYGEFPYQVHIKIAKHQCGGALVDRQSIVTAAHCVYHFITRAPVSKLQIVIGAYDIEDEQFQELPPQYFKVNKVKLHPNFRFSASHPDRYDIAILKLDKPVKYTDNVLPVCLPDRDIRFENMVGTVTGFGKTDPSLSNRYGTRLLQKVDVPIIDNAECERWHRTRGIDLKIFPEMMCAGYEDGLKDACVGDSGGPLVVKTSTGPNGSFRWTLAGITSAGFGCAQSRQPGIYHRVSHTVDWILDNLD